MPERWRKVSLSEYMSELGRLSGKTRRKRRLQREWRSFRGRLGALARQDTLLRRRVPFVGTVTRVEIARRRSEIAKESEAIRTQMRHIRYTELPILDEEIDAERRLLSEKIVPPKLKFIHYLVTANVATESGGTVLIISITLEYDVSVKKVDEYRKEAVAKIKRWFDVKFENVSVEPSAEESKTPLDVADKLREEDEEVSDIHYVWSWYRTGVYASKGEDDEGDIAWDEEIPTISQADLWGWKKKPYPRRRRLE